MNRTDFYDITTIDDVQEYDYLQSNISKFVTNYPVQYYRIETQDVGRPDLISYKIYGTVSYWWLILSLNSIEDPFNDMVVGTLLMIPDSMDVYDFYNKWALR